MNIQNEVFKKLMKRDVVHYGELPGEGIAITYDGFRAYRLEKSEVCFDLSKCKKMDGTGELFEIIRGETKLTLLNTIITSSSRMYAKLKGRGFEVYVNREYIKDFCCVEFYGAGETQPIKIVNPATQNVIAIILPVRLNDDLKKEATI